MAAQSLSLSSNLRLTHPQSSLYISLLPYLLAAILTNPSPYTTSPYPSLLLLLASRCVCASFFVFFSVSGFLLFYCHPSGSSFFIYYIFFTFPRLHRITLLGLPRVRSQARCCCWVDFGGRSGFGFESRLPRPRLVLAKSLPL
ncbi:hypothetical protein B0H14DRAFT_1232649 [Mycena olivaceomarginata]|nr:hypothetical protein B0H14DRAFT_1232649 [Mycena olivaceomarginata]